MVGKETVMQSWSRSLFWAYYLRQEKKVPNHLALNAYPGLIQLGPNYNAIVTFIDATTAELDKRETTEEKEAFVNSLPKLNDLSDMTLSSQTDMERNFFNTIYETVKGYGDDKLAQFAMWLIEGWDRATNPIFKKKTPEGGEAARSDAEVVIALKGFFDYMSQNYIVKKGKYGPDYIEITLGTGLTPTAATSDLGRFCGSIIDIQTYKQLYIQQLNSEGQDAYKWIIIGREFKNTDQLSTEFENLNIVFLSADKSIKDEVAQFIANGPTALVPLRSCAYIQAAITDDSDIIITPVEGNKHLIGPGETCLKRPQFTLLFSEPNRVRNMSGIVAFKASTSEELNAVWKTNFADVASSMEEKGDEEKLFLCQLQSTLFELQENLMRDDWWLHNVKHWLTTIKWDPQQLITAQLRAMAQVAAMTKDLGRATEIMNKMQVALDIQPVSSALCQFQFVATPPDVVEPGTNSALAAPPPAIPRMEPMENLNIAASELIRAQDYARQIYKGDKSDKTWLFKCNVPFFVFPYISEIPAESNKPREKEEQYDIISQITPYAEKGLTFIPENYEHDLRLETTPSWDLFLTWFRSNFWRLALSTSVGTNYRCVVFGHPNFLAQAFRRSSVAPGEVIPFSLNLERRSKPEGAGTTWYWEPVSAAAAAFKPNSRSRLGPNLAAIADLANNDPNAAYKEFAARIPKYGVALADVRNTVAAIKPRRKGFFGGESRNTYRRNFQDKIARIRSTLRLNAAAPAPPAGNLSSKLAAVVSRAEVDPNAAYKEFDALKRVEPTLAAAPKPIDAIVDSIKPRRTGFFGQGRNSYRRNLLTKIDNIRSSLRIPAPSLQPARRQGLLAELDRIVAAAKFDDSVIKQLDTLRSTYADVWPAANYETGLRTTLRTMQEKLKQKGGRRRHRTRKNRR